MIKLLLVVLFVSVFSVKLPDIYEIQYKTTYHPEGIFHFSKLSVDSTKSMIMDYKTGKSDIAICTPNKETLISFTNKSCDIRCIDGLKYSDPEKKCDGCSTYKLFYWLSLSKNSGKCDSDLSDKGTNYRYHLGDNYDINYCFDGRNPVGITIDKLNTKVVIEVYQWITDKNFSIDVPDICEG